MSSNILAQIDSLSGYIQATDTSLTFVTSNNLNNYNQLSGIVSQQSSIYNQIYFSAANITNNANINASRGNVTNFVNVSQRYIGNANTNISGNLGIIGNIICSSNNIISGFGNINGNSNISGNLGISGNLFTSSNVIFSGNVTGPSTDGNSAINTLLTTYSVPTDYTHFLNAAFINQANGSSVSSWNTFTQANVSQQPIYYSTGGYNNGPYVKFDGTNDYLQGVATNYQWATNGGQATFILIRYDVTPTWPDFKNMFTMTVNSNNTSAGAYFFDDYGPEWRTNYYNSSGTFLTPYNRNATITTSVYYLLSMNYASTGTNNYKAYLNGNIWINQTAAGTYTNLTGATPFIGGVPGYNNYKNQSVTAFLHYNRLLTATELTNVHNYMLNNINVGLSGGGGGTSSLGNLVYADFINRRLGVGMVSPPLQLLDLNGTANIIGILLQNGRYPFVSNTSGLRIDYARIDPGTVSTGTISFNFTFNTIPIIILLIDDTTTFSIRYQNATTSQFTWTASGTLTINGTVMYLAIGT